MIDISDKEIDQIKLTDLIEVRILQRVQDVFSEMSRMAALITDRDGVAITQGSNFSELCTAFCRNSPEGRKRCEQCDKMGAVTALEQEAPVYYYCHANLIDFAAPIVFKGHMIGAFIGGQVLPNKPNHKEMRRVARELNVDEDAFVSAADKVRVVPIDTIDRNTKFIYGYAEILSEMAYTTYVARKMTDEALRAATAKADFLANMSHEIRTPLNAIIGMSQIAMREDMSEAARKCMDQIMNSGKMLLKIINDILDYSKMESGKLEIVNNEYEMLSMVRDVAGIISNRIGDKNIELIIDVEPSIPQWLYGDEIRIKQIMVNLANNAIKYTNSGYVALRLGYKWTASDEISLRFKVQDTGIGIKKEAFHKLFDSFEQVDSKRNREVEGTGLGLAIVKNLVELMDGKISVESEYGEGSTFSVKIPQKVVDDHACITPMEDCPCVIGLISNPYVRAEMYKDVERIGAQYVEADSEEDIDELVKRTEAKFLFVSENLLSQKLKEYAAGHKELTTVRITPLNNSDYVEIPGITTIKKPLHSINVAAILRNMKLEITSKNDITEVDFTAPRASILIVDDNGVNLTVTTGLLEPVHMQMDTASSGKQAIEMISNKHYDMVFMDHMMPEIDGVETTHIIRRLHPEYDDVPIIALTANAVAGTREMFLQEGMNDFVAKPIELKVILAKLKKYLPPEKIEAARPSGGEGAAEKTQRESLESVKIPGLDVKYALNLLGSQKLFWRVVKDYYKVIDHTYKKIKKCETQENWSEYCVEVHALKSASRQIGAVTLSNKAERLEKAASQEEADVIHKLTDDMLADYLRLQEVLGPYCTEKKREGGQQASSEIMSGFLGEMQLAVENLDIGAAEAVLSRMKQYSYGGECGGCFKRLAEAVEEIDLEAAEQILKEWIKVL